MSPNDSHLIIGAGLAGAAAAQALRDQGFDGSITMIGNESELPYERPPLSKDYLMGTAPRETLLVHQESWYRDHAVDLRLSTAAVGIDPAEHTVTLADGTALDYSSLLLTTGSSPRVLPIPGADRVGVHYLRGIGDSDRIKASFRTVAHLAIIGGGWIGLETAAAARAAGIAVTVLEAAPLPLLRVLGPEVAQVFADLHRSHGVDLRCGVQIEEITGTDERVTGVALSDGSHLRAEAIIIGAGIAPNTRLAAEAGLKVDNGIRVDEHLRTSDTDIYAAGDVANAYHPVLHRQIRVEHWANALHQPVTAARAMLGQDAAYDRLPYFFTDQYELGMEYIGYVEPDEYDEVVFRGEAAGGEFLAFWLSRGRVLAGMTVNTWDLVDSITSLITAGQQIDTGRLTDPTIPLHSLLDD